jgi:hypothetical protein
MNEIVFCLNCKHVGTWKYPPPKSTDKYPYVCVAKCKNKTSFDGMREMNMDIIRAISQTGCKLYTRKMN